MNGVTWLVEAPAHYWTSRQDTPKEGPWYLPSKTPICLVLNDAEWFTAASVTCTAPRSDGLGWSLWVTKLHLVV